MTTVGIPHFSTVAAALLTAEQARDLENEKWYISSVFHNDERNCSKIFIGLCSFIQLLITFPKTIANISTADPIVFLLKSHPNAFEIREARYSECIVQYHAFVRNTQRHRTIFELKKWQTRGGSGPDHCAII